MFAALELRQIRSTHLRGLSLTVEPGQRVGLVGPAGAGKSELAAIIAGSTQPREGWVVVDGVDVTHRGPTERAGLGLSCLTQRPDFLPTLTVFEHVLLATKARGRLSRRLALAHASRIVSVSGLVTHADRPAGELDLAGSRRLQVAQILAAPRRLVVVDELSWGIDAPTRHELGTLLMSATREGAAILWLDVPEMPPLPVDRLVVLVEGRLVADGQPARVLAGAELRQLKHGVGLGRSS